MKRLEPELEYNWDDPPYVYMQPDNSGRYVSLIHVYDWIKDDIGNEAAYKFQASLSGNEEISYLGHTQFDGCFITDPRISCECGCIKFSTTLNPEVIECVVCHNKYGVLLDNK